MESAEARPGFYPEMVPVDGAVNAVFEFWDSIYPDGMTDGPPSIDELDIANNIAQIHLPNTIWGYAAADEITDLTCILMRYPEEVDKLNEILFYVSYDPEMHSVELSLYIDKKMSMPNTYFNFAKLLIQGVEAD